MQNTQAETRPPYVSFEYRPVEDRNASIEAGHYVAKDVVFAVVTRPGSRDSLDVEAATWLANLKKKSEDGQIPQTWYPNFLARYEAFLKNEELPESGTPIKGWVVISPSAQKALIEAGFRTVEALAEAPDNGISSIGTGALSYRQKARLWLETAKSTGTSVERLNDLTQKVADLTALAEKLVAENKALTAKLNPEKNPLVKV